MKNKLKYLASLSPLGLLLAGALLFVKITGMEKTEKKWWPCEPDCSLPPDQCPEPPCS